MSSRKRTRSSTKDKPIEVESEVETEHARQENRDTAAESKDTEEEQCGICLEKPQIRGILNSCNHCFCFVCIQQWSHTSNTCPFCNQRFSSITQLDPNNPRKRAKKVSVPTVDQRVAYSDEEPDWDDWLDEFDEDDGFIVSDDEIDDDGFDDPSDFFLENLIEIHFNFSHHPHPHHRSSERSSLASSVPFIMRLDTEVIDLTVDDNDVHDARNHGNRDGPQTRAQSHSLSPRSPRTRSSSRRSNQQTEENHQHRHQHSHHQHQHRHQHSHHRRGNQRTRHASRDSHSAQESVFSTEASSSGYLYRIRNRQ